MQEQLNRRGVVRDTRHRLPASERRMPWLFRAAMGLGLLCVVLPGQEANRGSSPAPRLAHPPVILKDEAGRNVLESGKPISTRHTCGGDCHDYDFIADSFHFQQGKTEMDPLLLSSHGVSSFNSSPGMFGKFSIIPNRQLTHESITDASDADMSQPEWLTKCGGCHVGGGISEYDLRGQRFLSPGAKPSALDASYTIRDREKGAIVPWTGKRAVSQRPTASCATCRRPAGQRGKRRSQRKLPVGEQCDACRHGNCRRRPGRLLYL